jgi:TPR repeat protein
MMLAQKNVVAAWMLFARAADAGLGIVALKLANTYDPQFIADHNLIGIKADLLQAEEWYHKAAAMGERDAERRLKALGASKGAVAAQ